MVKMTCQIDAKIPTDLFRASRTFISTLVKASRQSSKLQLQTIKKKVTVANGRSRSFCSQLTAHAATFFSSHQPSQRNQLYTLLAITKFEWIRAQHQLRFNNTQEFYTFGDERNQPMFVFIYMPLILSTLSSSTGQWSRLFSWAHKHSCNAQSKRIPVLARGTKHLTNSLHSCRAPKTGTSLPYQMTWSSLVAW